MLPQLTINTIEERFDADYFLKNMKNKNNGTIDLRKRFMLSLNLSKF